MAFSEDFLSALFSELQNYQQPLFPKFNHGLTLEG
tara:strand:+ start:2181 stop:2285 length:105 start_codon:yes stop_codon:yes gene_type:complete